MDFTRGAASRFLTPGGRLIPSYFEIFALPAALPSDVIRNGTFTSERVREWRAAYGIDFAPLVESSPRSLWKVHSSPRALSRLERVASPLRVLRRDLAALTETGFAETVRGTIAHVGRVEREAARAARTRAPPRA